MRKERFVSFSTIQQQQTILYLCPHGVTLCTSYFIVIIVSEIVR